jgi:lipid II:glycine glycyltransferase (peptidoglycan interpeptide bridge formation enzyme)
MTSMLPQNSPLLKFCSLNNMVCSPSSPLISEFCVTFECQVTNIKRQFYRYNTMMNQADIFKKIGVILNELQEQYEFLAQNPEQLNELELELFLANANFLSYHVEIVL